jgi:hypothetical protein
MNRPAGCQGSVSRLSGDCHGGLKTAVAKTTLWPRNGDYEFDVMPQSCRFYPMLVCAIQDLPLALSSGDIGLLGTGFVCLGPIKSWFSKV